MITKMSPTASKTDRLRSQSKTFRLRPDQIQYLESLAPGEGTSAGLNKAITICQAIGCSNNLLNKDGADITIAIIGRLERLETKMNVVARAANVDERLI